MWLLEFEQPRNDDVRRGPRARGSWLVARGSGLEVCPRLGADEAAGSCRHRGECLPRSERQRLEQRPDVRRGSVADIARAPRASRWGSLPRRGRQTSAPFAGVERETRPPASPTMSADPWPAEMRAPPPMPSAVSPPAPVRPPRPISQSPLRPRPGTLLAFPFQRGFLLSHRSAERGCPLARRKPATHRERPRANGAGSLPFFFLVAESECLPTDARWLGPSRRLVPTGRLAVA